ncbi:MAG TPA: N(4)-(beta-N-acetylglucosaminyl)-L-asparaginase [Gemmatimonadota bacterium]|nr:N(4)-(beta-N-acetylglucosaminyl)-L-asparaginase [Gemmatimonadota bacterium]
MGSITRREFLAAGAVAGVAAGAVGPTAAARAAWRPVRRSAGRQAGPVVVASSNGHAAVARALEMIQGGSDPLDAVIAGVNLVEEDPEDYTVGYGGLPNALGVVQLDSCCMHGPTHRAGGVAALEGFKYPSRVARLVMESTDHVLLVGAGAKAFALENGFVEEDLLTDTSRQVWLYWRGTLGELDDYLPPDISRFTPLAKQIIENNPDLFYPEQRRTTGTINCCAVDAAGNISGVTTTSGLFFKIPGRVGDSPIVGAGLYVDNDVGAAGSTGRGEANLLNLTSHLIVEEMRRGLSPTEACLAGCRRIVENNVEERLQRPDGRPDFNVAFYALNKDGEYGSASIYGPGGFAVADARGPARREDRAILFTDQ